MIEGINSSLAVNSQGTSAKQAGDNAALLNDANKQNSQIVAGTESKAGSFFSLDSTSDVRTVLQVIDSSNGEVVRQFPTENQLRAYSRAQEVLQSVTTVSTQPAVEASEPPVAEEVNVAADFEIEYESAESAYTDDNAPVVAQQSGQTPATPIADPSGLF